VEQQHAAGEREQDRQRRQQRGQQVPGAPARGGGAHRGDRARAALLLYGCLLLEDRVPDAVAALREYLEKTTRPLNPRDHTAVRLLRHHATGGGLKPGNPEEACYFGLYAWKALDERTTAVPDLELAVREAPEPERLLAKIALEP